MTVWDDIKIPLRPEEYSVRSIETIEKFLANPEPQVIYDLSPLLARLTKNVQFKIVSYGKQVHLVFPVAFRDSRHVVQQMRGFNVFLNCDPFDGAEIVQFLHENATAAFQPVGIAQERGLIYLRDIADAMLVKLRFNNIQVSASKEVGKLVVE